MKIVQEAGWEEGVEYSLVFERMDAPGAGFSFPCDREGRVDEAKMAGPMRENLRKCREHVIPVRAGRVSSHIWHRRMPAVGRCECGRGVVLSDFTNTCECGRDYNTAGQQLAPRSQWGAETGETWQDCY